MKTIKNYWEAEPDTIIDTDKNILRFWADARKLQVSMPNWTDKDDNTKPGKTVTIDVEALRATEGAAELFCQVLEGELFLG